MAERLPRITASEALRKLRRDGWVIERQAGSHATLRHPVKTGQLTLPMHVGRIVKLGVMRSIITNAGLTPEEFRRL
jgi:predicted RNA binding protein YcfA (HicA-like mRNA interferase family)